MSVRYSLERGALALITIALLGAAACSRAIDRHDEPAGPGGAANGGTTDGGTTMDAASDPFNNAAGSSTPPSNFDPSTLLPIDAGSDAFFINDPPPPYCGPESDRPDVSTVSGSIDCPSDKNRQGCRCEEEGVMAPCWPGKRIHRDHGICEDGMTRCVRTPEFGLLWGECVGYVLPLEGVLVGPDACGCFSSGRWSLSNLSPCIIEAGSGTYLYSSTLDADGKILCGNNIPDPPPVPPEPWGTSTLNVDCAGNFRLCYTIKAGDVDAPRSNDCVIMQTCVDDVWYPEANVDLALPDLPPWVSTDRECAAQFVANGGYGEMSVIGESIECDVVDDGMGNPYVFHRTNYCPPSCQATPDTPECRVCQTGGSGMFE